MKLTETCEQLWYVFWFDADARIFDFNGQDLCSVAVAWCDHDDTSSGELDCVLD